MLKTSFKKFPVVKIKTADNHKYEGSLIGVKGDSILLVDSDTSALSTKVHFNDIQNMSLNKKSKILQYGAVGLISMALGMSSIEWDYFSGGTILEGGFVISNLCWSVGYLMGIDVDIPWDQKSDDEKKAKQK